MTGLLVVLLVLLAHTWALEQLASVLGPLRDAPPPASQIAKPMRTRTLIAATPETSTRQQPEPVALAPAASPSARRPAPSEAATPAPAPVVVATMEPAPAAEPVVPAARPDAVPASVALPAAPASSPGASSASLPTPVEPVVAEHSAPAVLPAREPPVSTSAVAPPPPASPASPASISLVPAALEQGVAGVASAPQTPPAAALRPLLVPASVGLVYQLEINSFPLPARAELRWRHDGAQYEASLSLSSLLSIVRTSKGAITPQGLEPLRYGEKITARGETAVHFQRDKGIVSFSNNKPSAALVAGMQDEVSAFFMLAAQLGGDPRRYTTGTEIPLQTVDSRALRSIVFVVGPPQTLELPGGRMQTVYLSHSEPPAFEGSRGSRGEVWAAPALDYLPVRIRITEPSGTTYDLRWSQTLAP